jgi:hypothetical protein
VVERSGVVPVARRAERFCWAKMMAGTKRAKPRKNMPGAKNLFVTQPS